MTEKQFIINDKYSKVLNDFQSLDISKDPIDQCFDVLHATAALSEFIDSTKVPNKNSQNPPAGYNIFDLFESFTNFFTLDIFLPDQQQALFIAFLPLYQSVIYRYIDSSIFNASEYDASWKYFQKEFVQCAQSIMPFQFRPTISELLSQCEGVKPISMKIVEYVQNMHIKLSDFVQHVDYDAKSEHYLKAYKEVVKTRQNIFSVIKSDKGKDWQLSIPPPFVAAFKIVEDIILNSYKFTKLKEIVQALNSVPKYLHFPQDKQSPVRDVLITSAKMLLIILRNLITFQISESEFTTLETIFNSVNQIEISLKMHNDIAIGEKWEKLLHSLDFSFFNNNVTKEQEALANIKSLASLFCINYPKMASDVAEIESLYNTICSSARNIYSLMILYLLLSRAAVSSTNNDFSVAILQFRKLIIFRIYYTNIISITEGCIPLAMKFSSLGGKSEISKYISVLTSAFEEIQQAGLIVDGDYQYAYTRYKAFLKFINYLAKSNEHEEDIKNLLRFHPSVEYISKFYKFGDEMTNLLNDIKLRQDNASIFTQFNRLKSFKIGSLQWIESASLFFQFSLGRILDAKEVVKSYSSLFEYLKIVNEITTMYWSEDLSKKLMRMSSDGVPKQNIIVDAAISIISDYEKLDNSKLAVSASKMNLYLMYSDLFNEQDAAKLMTDIQDSVVIKSDPEIIIKAFQMLDKLDYLRFTHPVEVDPLYNDLIGLYNAILFEKFPETDVIETRTTKLVNALKSIDQKVTEGISSEKNELLEYIQQYILLARLMITVKECDQSSILRMCFNFSILTALIKESENLIQSGMIIDDKKDKVKELQDETSKALALNAFQFFTDYENSGRSSELIMKWKSLGPFVNYKTLYSCFQQNLSIMNTVSANAMKQFFEDVEELFKEFVIVPTRLTLFNIKNIFHQLLLNCQTISLENLEIVIFKRKLQKFFEKVKSVLFMMDVSELPVIPTNDKSFIKLITDLQCSGIRGDTYDQGMTTLSQSRTIYLLSLSEDLDPLDIARSHYEESILVNDKIKKEIEITKEKIAKYPELSKMKIKEGQDELDRFNKHMTETKEKESHSRQLVEELKKRKDELKQEKEKYKLNEGENNDLSVPHFDNEMSSVISLLLRDEEFAQPRTEADFIAEQLQEALRTNLRLKKSIAVHSFPHEKAVFTPTEFAAVIDKFSGPTAKVSPFTTQRANESAALRQQLRDLHAERDQAFRSIIKETQKAGFAAKRKFNSESYYDKMKGLNTRGIFDGSSRKNQKEQFLEFTEISDQFLLEVSAEIEDLEQEIRDLEAGKAPETLDMDAKTQILRTKLSTQLSSSTQETN